MACPDRNACQVGGLFPLTLQGLDLRGFNLRGLALRGVLPVSLLTLLLVGLPMPSSHAQTIGGALQAVTATPAPKSPQTGGATATGAQSNNNNGKSLNNGPQVKPKASIQSIPTIQQRVPIKPRT